MRTCAMPKIALHKDVCVCMGVGNFFPTEAESSYAKALGTSVVRFI